MTGSFALTGRGRRRAGLATLVCAALVSGCLAWCGAVVTPAVGPAAAAPAAAAQADDDASPLWTFGFIGDTHAGAELTETLFSKLAGREPRFVLHLGDMVDHGERADEWQRLLDTADRHGLELLPVVGNHDKLPARDDRGRHCMATYFPELPGTAYRFEYGGLAFLMLNSEHWFSPWTEQGQALRRELADAAAPPIVCLHRPVYTCSTRDWPRMLLRRLWLHGALRDGRALAVLTGHNHYYERTRRLDGVTYVVSGGGAKNCYEAGRPNARTAALVERRNHYGLVEVFSDRLCVRVQDVDDQTLDAFCLPLPAGQVGSDAANLTAKVHGLRPLLR